MPRKLDRPVLSFKSAGGWERWLAKNHARAGAVWLRISKKDAREKSITYAEALDEALCFGWIDSQKRAYDKSSWVQKFGPRKPASGWSKLNTVHAARLIKAGKMKPAGLKGIQAAKRDGRWKRAYDSPANARVPADFMRALNKSNKAKRVFETLNRSNTY